MANLFSSFTLGSMTMKNRTFMAPMSLGYESEDGTPSSKQQAYWLARAKGGVGCIITDATTVDPRTPYLGNTLFFNGEESIKAHKQFTDQIHAYGTKVIPQITHPGPESISAFFGVPPVGPSTYLNSMYQQVRALAVEELPAIVNMYGEASYMAKLAGYDGIELHCAHAYMLLGSFLSPLRNKRTDEYGGELMNRARLLIEVIDAIKEKCGQEFPIILRISGDEKLAGGNTLEDIKQLVPVLIEHGIDAFEISGGANYEIPQKIIPAHGEKEGTNVKQAVEIKKISSVPVIVVGKINTPQLAQSLVESGQVDGVVIGRSLIADPEFVNKMQLGHDNEIAPCASCLVGCVGEQMKRKPGTCVINPFAGHEDEWKIVKTAKQKKVAVVGGGIGGMAAARMLTIRGHHVVLFEKENRLGGQIHLASIPPYKDELKKWIVYLENEIKRLNVFVECNHFVTKEELIDSDFDTVVIATGSSPIVLSQGDHVCSAHAFLNGDVMIPSGKVLVVGGGLVGLDTVETLNARKQGDLSIVLIEMTSSSMNDLDPNDIESISVLKDASSAAIYGSILSGICQAKQFVNIEKPVFFI